MLFVITIITIKKVQTSPSLKNQKILSQEIEVFQVLDDSIALAKCNDFGSGHYGTVFLIKGNENLYDDQKIDLSHFSVQQIGIYRYETRDDLEKAVPFIEIKK